MKTPTVFTNHSVTTDTRWQFTPGQSATEHLKETFRQGNGNSLVGDRVFHPQFVSRKYFKVKHFSYPQNNAKPTYIFKEYI